MHWYYLIIMFNPSCARYNILCMLCIHTLIGNKLILLIIFLQPIAHLIKVLVETHCVRLHLVVERGVLQEAGLFGIHSHV